MSRCPRPKPNRRAPLGIAGAGGDSFVGSSLQDIDQRGRSGHDGSRPRECSARHHGSESTSLSRRGFARAGAATALSAASYARVLGANDRIGVGFIGFGLIGKRHVLDFRAEPDVDAVAVAEVHRGRLDEATALIGGSVRGLRRFPPLLDDRDVDAVVVSTPDHWHALMTMMACAAGKDVYVEKPLSLFVREGRWMIDVARRHGRVVQVGTQQRSGPHYQRARELIQNGPPRRRSARSG